MPISAPHHRTTTALRAALAGTSLLLLYGCNLSDIPGLGPDPRALQKEAEAKAIGGACRYAQRGPEDCYALNPQAPKAQVFAGWKDMDQYMRDNKIEGTPSTIAKSEPPPVEQPKPKRKRASDDDIETESR